MAIVKPIISSIVGKHGGRWTRAAPALLVVVPGISQGLAIPADSVAMRCLDEMRHSLPCQIRRVSAARGE